MTRDSPATARGRANTDGVSASEQEMTSAVGPSAQTSGDRTVVVPDTAASDVAHGWITRLIKKEGPGILRMLWRLLGTEADVMDAYQDCFCKLAARKNRGDLKSAKAYAYRTASNIAVEMIRTRRRRRAHWPNIAAERDLVQEQVGDDQADGGEESARFEDLREAIAALPGHLRNVVLLRDLSRLPYREVGKLLGIDPATARVYRRHAVVKLAESLGQGCES